MARMMVPAQVVGLRARGGGRGGRRRMHGNCRLDAGASVAWSPSGGEGMRATDYL